MAVVDERIVMLVGRTAIPLLVSLAGCAVWAGKPPARCEDERNLVDLSLLDIPVARPLGCQGYVKLSVLGRSAAVDVLCVPLPPLTEANRTKTLREVVESATGRVMVLPPDFADGQRMDREYDYYTRRLPGLRSGEHTVGSLLGALFHYFDRDNGKSGFKCVTVCTERYIQVVPLVDDHYDPLFLDRVPGVISHPRPDHLGDR